MAKVVSDLTFPSALHLIEAWLSSLSESVCLGQRIGAITGLSYEQTDNRTQGDLGTAWGIVRAR